MKSQTSQVARSCRIREWASMVQECRNRPNGMSVDEWCQANNITRANYYIHNFLSFYLKMLFTLFFVFSNRNYCRKPEAMVT